MTPSTIGMLPIKKTILDMLSINQSSRSDCPPLWVPQRMSLKSFSRPSFRHRRVVDLCLDPGLCLNLLLLGANLVVDIRLVLVLLKVSRLHPLGIKLIELLEAHALCLRIKEPSENGYDQTQAEKDEANLAAKVSGIGVDLRRYQRYASAFGARRRTI